MAAKRPKKIRDTWNLRISKVKKTGDTLISKSQKVTDNYSSAPLKSIDRLKWFTENIQILIDLSG